MSRSGINAKKIAVLAVVKENREILFASFNNNAVTKVNKEAAWKLVLEKAQSLQIANASKTWTYARDAMFGVWKSRTLVSNYSLGILQFIALSIYITNVT